MNEKLILDKFDWIVLIICAILSACLTTFMLVAIFKYGNAPVEEIPNWANWFLQRG